MIDQNFDTTIRELTSIWERIFGHPHIETEDDFFELGGTASLAVQLFAEISEKLGANLHPAAICISPTISALAARLRQPQLSLPAIPLRSGTEAPPIFMTHGIGSSVIDLVPLARRMQVRQPIYGMEARGNDGREEPLDRIDDIAQFFLESVRKLQPEGPYFLIGYSLGGLVTFEMARLLTSARQKIALLVMLDSYPDRHHLTRLQHALLAIQLAKNRMATWMQTSGRSNARSALVQPGSPLGTAFCRVKEAQHHALRNYRPRFYEGQVKFARAAIPTDFPSDPIPVWSHLARTFDVETVPGTHLDMLTTHCELLSLIIDRHVREATAGS
jgi:acetoacetyl-CoA synthetase